MSTPTRRRPSPAVYRRRRLLALILVLVVVAGILTLVVALWRPWAGGGAGGGANAASTAPTETLTPSSTPQVPSAPPSGTAAASASAPAPAPSTTVPVIAACSTADISVLAVTDKDSYGAGELPQLSITLSNTSAVPCLINVGTTTQSFVITSGTDTWWRSTDCQTESSDQVVQLAGGQTVSSVTPVPWDRTRSAVDTCASARPQAPAGYFHLQVSIGGIQAADTKMFELR